MTKFKKSQIVMLSLLIVLIFITPLISSSIRPKYLYFVLNLLIIALGAEAGLISFTSNPSIEDKKPPTPTPQTSNTTPQDQITSSSDKNGNVKAIGKSKLEKIKQVENNNNTAVKKCPSVPSLFFIGGENSDGNNYQLHDVKEEEENEEIVNGQQDQELFTKAETFISNFYNQLKMQREESWNKIHGLYHKAF